VLLIEPHHLPSRTASSLAGQTRRPGRGGKGEVLGIDDFAFRRGARYGTILVNLERHKVADLLPERSQESLVAWLERHSVVRTATRDRSNIYREALAKGAPEAIQVADRWHLMHNLALVLEEFLLQKGFALREAAAPEAAPEDRRDEAFGSGPVMPNRPRNHDRKMEEAARKRHERLVRQWEQKEYLTRLCASDAALADAHKLAQDFANAIYSEGR
jgi:transposase